MATVKQLLDMSHTIRARGIVGFGASIARSGLGGLQGELSSYAHSDVRRSVPCFREALQSKYSGSPVSSIEDILEIVSIVCSGLRRA